MHPIDAIRACCGRLPVPSPFTGLHGRIGMIKNAQLITSPNATWIPDIQWQTSKVRLREDMRFGPDDYTLFPQWHHLTVPWLPAIPKPPGRGEVSPYAIMWYSPQRNDFTVVAGSDPEKRPGYVHQTHEPQLLALYTGLASEVHNLMTSLIAAQDATSMAKVLSSGSTALRHAWVILTQFAAGFEEKRLELAEFQRAWLELKGMLNYFTWTMERVNALPGAPPRPTEACVGCIVQNAHIAMEYFDMGVPVWFVREKMNVLMGDVYIETATTLSVKLGDHGEDVSLVPDASFPDIYTQTPQLHLHFHVQQQFSRIRSVVQRRSVDGELVQTDTPRANMSRRDAGTMIIELRTLRMQTSAGADRAAASSSTSTAIPPPPASSSHSSSRSGNLSRAVNQTRVGSHHPRKPAA